MGLEGQQTTLAVTQLISSLTQGYVEGMKLARDEESRLEKIQLIKEREARIAASEQQRLGLAKLRFVASEEERGERAIARGLQAKVTKQRSTLLGLQISREKTAAAAIDTQLGNIDERLNSNFKEFASAKKARDNSEQHFRMVRAEWENIKDQSNKESPNYIRIKKQWENATQERETINERIANLSKQQDYLTSTRFLYRSSPQRGQARRIHSMLTSSGYTPRLAQRFVVDLNLASIASTNGDNRPLEILTRQLELDNIPMSKKKSIGKMIYNFVGAATAGTDRGVTTEPTPYVQHIQEKQTALQEEISAPVAEELALDDAIAARIYEKEGMMEEFTEDDPEAQAAIEEQKVRTRRIYGKPKSVIKPLGKRLSPLAKERLEKAKKSKREIKKSPYWRRRFQDEQMMY